MGRRAAQEGCSRHALRSISAGNCLREVGAESLENRKLARGCDGNLRPPEARVGIRALGAAKGAPGKAGRPCCWLRTRRKCREAGPGACVQLTTPSRTPGLQKPTDLYVIPAVPPTSSCPWMPPASLFLSHPTPGPTAKVFKTVFKNSEFTSVISHLNYYRRSSVGSPCCGGLGSSLSSQSDPPGARPPRPSTV